VPNGAGSSSRRPEAPASPEPEADRDGDPAELTERGQLRLGELEGWNRIWVFPKIMVPQNGWFRMEKSIKVDDLGVPLFLETST